MTTDVSAYDGLKHILPKLAQPSWVWQIDAPKLRPNETLIALQADSRTKQAKKKAAKQAYRAYRRLHAAIHGSA